MYGFTRYLGLFAVAAMLAGCGVKESFRDADAGTGSTFVTVAMQATFEKGAGTEQFVYRKGDGGRLALVAYTIQSQEIMLD